MNRYATLARPFTLLPPLLGIVSGAVCAWGSAHNPDPARALTSSVILTVDPRLGLRRVSQRRKQRAEPDLRPRDRSHQQAKPSDRHRRDLHPRSLDLHLDHVRPRHAADVAGRRVSLHDVAGQAHRAARRARMFLHLSHRARGDVRLLRSRARAHEGACDRRESDDCDSARLPAQSRGLDDGRACVCRAPAVSRLERAVVHRLGLHVLPPRRGLDERLHRHRRRSRRQLPHAADPLSACAAPPG